MNVVSDHLRWINEVVSSSMLKVFATFYCFCQIQTVYMSFSVMPHVNKDKYMNRMVSWSIMIINRDVKITCILKSKSTMIKPLKT